MNRMRSFLGAAAACALIFPTSLAGAAVVVDYNFNGGADGQLVSGSTGGATAGILDSSVNHPNTLIDASGNNATNGSIIKHWSDNPSTETAGGSFAPLTYDTTLPPGAELRAGYDGQAVNFTRSGVLHNTTSMPHISGDFSAFARIYWRDASLYDFETLFSTSSRVNHAGWWVGIDAVSKRLTWSFNGPDPSMESPGAAAPAITANKWTDIAITFSGDGSDGATDTLKVYVDGNVVGTYVGTASFALPQSLRDDWSFWNNSTLQLGGSYRGAPPFQPEAFDGLIEKFTLFDEVLNDAQVKSLTIPEPFSSAIALIGLSSVLLLRRCCASEH